MQRGSRNRFSGDGDRRSAAGATGVLGTMLGRRHGSGMRAHRFAGRIERQNLANERWRTRMPLQADRTIAIAAMMLCLVRERNGTRDRQQENDDDSFQHANPSMLPHAFSLRLTPEDVKAVAEA